MPVKQTRKPSSGRAPHKDFDKCLLSYFLKISVIFKWRPPPPPFPMALAEQASA
jgi:hypothetical protein